MSKNNETQSFLERFTSNLAKQIGLQGLNNEIKIQSHSLSTKDMMDFVEYVKDKKKSNPDSTISLSEYVAEKFYTGQDNLVVVPDLTGVHLYKNVSRFPLYIDLSGVDFSGSIIKNTKFDGCDLTGAIFTETDLQGSYFDNTKLVDIDFRGANLGHCTFGESYNYDRKETFEEYYDNIESMANEIGYSLSDGFVRYSDREKDDERKTKYEEAKERGIKLLQSEETRHEKRIDHQKKFISGIKLSVSKDIGKFYATDTIEEQKERKEKHAQAIITKEKEVAVAYSKLSYPELAMGKLVYKKPVPIIYIYPKVTTQDVEDYDYYYHTISRKSFTLSQFMASKLQPLPEGAIVHADLSGSVDKNGNLIPVDLSGLKLPILRFIDAVNVGSAKCDDENKFTQEDIEQYTITGPLKKMSESGASPNYDKYQAALQELEDLKKAPIPEKDYVIHETFGRLFDGYSTVYDSCYKRGSSAEERQQNVIYIKTSKEDVVEYLKQLKTNPELTLSDFVASQGKTHIPKGTIVHADLSSSLDKNGKLVRVDLSGLDFEGAKLQGTDFSGSNLTGAKFNNANISNASFESAIISGKSQFQNTIAVDVNFFNTDLRDAIIKDSNFSRAYMPKSNGTKANVTDSHFDYADLSYGKWDDVHIDKSFFNHANLEGVSLANAIIKRTQMKNVNLNKAILLGCNIFQSDLTGALMNKCQANNLTLVDTIFKNVEAEQATIQHTIITSCSLSEGLFDALCDHQNDKLPQTVLDKITAEVKNFKDNKKKQIEASRQDSEKHIMEEVNLRFADMKNALILGASMSKMNLTAADLSDATIGESIIKDSILAEIKAENTKFTNLLLAGVDLQGAQMKTAYLYRMKLEKVKVNAATTFTKTYIVKIDGKFTYVDNKGKETAISHEELKIISTDIERAKHVNAPRRAIGWILQKCGNSAEAIGEWIKKPEFSKKLIIIGAAAGAAIAMVYLPIFLALTGTSSVVIGTAAGLATMSGFVIAAGATGAAVGYYFTKSVCMLSTLASSGIGLLMAGPLGAGMAAGAAVCANHILLFFTGKSVDQHFGRGTVALGSAMHKSGEVIGLTKNQVKYFEQYLQAKEKGKSIADLAPTTNEMALKIEKQGIGYDIKRQILAKSSKSADTLSPAVSSKTNPKPDQLKEGTKSLQNAVKAVTKQKGDPNTPPVKKKKEGAQSKNNISSNNNTRGKG